MDVVQVLVLRSLGLSLLLDLAQCWLLLLHLSRRLGGGIDRRRPACTFEVLGCFVCISDSSG